MSMTLATDIALASPSVFFDRHRRAPDFGSDHGPPFANIPTPPVCSVQSAGVAYLLPFGIWALRRPYPKGKSEAFRPPERAGLDRRITAAGPSGTIARLVELRDWGNQAARHSNCSAPGLAPMLLYAAAGYPGGRWVPEHY
jgi:hypothetical protein